MTFETVSARSGSGIESIPEELARRFVAENRLHAPDAKLVGKTGFSTHRFNVLRRTERIPSYGEVELHVDFQSSVGHADTLIFEYFGADGALVARLHLETDLTPHGDGHELKHTHTFDVMDRWVDPAAREKGIATRILLQAEDWVRQVARLQKHDARMVIATGQKSIMEWLKKRPELGYRASLFDRGILRAINAHPERFKIENGTNQLGQTLEGYVFKKGVKGRTWEDAVRVRYSKRIRHK